MLRRPAQAAITALPTHGVHQEWAFLISSRVYPNSTVEQYANRAGFRVLACAITPTGSIGMVYNSEIAATGIYRDHRPI